MNSGCGPKGRRDSRCSRHGNPLTGGIRFCRERDDPQRWAPLLYSLMERLDEADLGSPGPLVHTLEACSGYRPLLAESLPRKPSPLTVWMANRVLDSDPPDTPEWLELLRRSADHPAASAQAQADARGFLEYQATRPQRP